MKPSEENILKISNKLHEALAELDRASGWTEAEIGNEQLGAHCDALRQHLDNAIGRASTTLRWLQVLRS